MSDMPGVARTVFSHDLGLSEWNILTVFHGSHAYGLSTGTSDVDIKAICVPPASYYIGLKQYGSRGTKDFWVDGADVVIWEARKAISLLARGNPNVLDLLWCDEDCVISANTAGLMLRENRGVFTGKHIYASFTGYARGQLKRMSAFARGEDRLRTGSMGEKRKRVVEEFGYDTKNAAHMVRLLRMGIEFLETGALNVRRADDREELLSIKRGEWDIGKVEALAEVMFKQAEKALAKSLLPEGPNEIAVNKLCVDVVREAQKKYGQSL